MVEKRGVAACCIGIGPHSWFVWRHAPLFSGRRLCAVCWKETQHGDGVRQGWGIWLGKRPWSLIWFKLFITRMARTRVANVLVFCVPCSTGRHQSERGWLITWMIRHSWYCRAQAGPAVAKQFYSLQLYPKWECDRKPHTLLESRRQRGAVSWQPPGKIGRQVKDGSRSSSFHSVYYH